MPYAQPNSQKGSSNTPRVKLAQQREAGQRLRATLLAMIQGPMVRKVQLQVGQRGLVVCGQRNLRMRAALCGTIFNRAGERWRS
jgi:hypothetical protein